MQYNYAQLNPSAVCVGVSAHPVALSLAANMVELDSFDLGILGKRYLRAAGLWEELPSVPTIEPRIVSVKGFRFRFTPEEKAAIEWAAVDRPDQPEAQRMQAAALRATLADQAAAQFIDLDDADTVVGVQGLEAMGLLAAGRAAEILGAPVQPQELP